MQTFNRIKIWAEQKQVTIPSLFFQYYKQIGVSDEEAMMILHVLAFQTEGNDFPTPAMMTERLCLSENEISHLYQRLIQKGVIQLLQETDADGIIYEKFSLYPLWDKILYKMEQEEFVQLAQAQKVNDRTIFNLLEQELGRLLSAIEIEQVSMWMDHDGHSPEVIKEAVKEAVLANKLSLRYIDRILFEWKKKHLKTVEQVRTHAEKFRAHTLATKTHVQTVGQSNHSPTNTNTRFYNWLDERE